MRSDEDPTWNEWSGPGAQCILMGEWIQKKMGAHTEQETKARCRVWISSALEVESIEDSHKPRFRDSGAGIEPKRKESGPPSCLES